MSKSTYTIRTLKGSHEGTLTQVCRWQAEYQGAMAAIHWIGADGEEQSVDVDAIDFDGEDLDLAISAVELEVSIVDRELAVIAAEKGA